MSNTEYTILLSCAKGTVQLCEIEARELGLQVVKTNPTLVQGMGDLDCVYRLCLWLRTASRVLIELNQSIVKTVEDIYRSSKQVGWEDIFSSESSIMIRFSGKGSGIRDTQFGALTVKDAIVDRFRESNRPRPSIDKLSPDLKVDAYLHKEVLTLALDVSSSIHQRGYRTAHGVAPIRETLAAAMIMRAQWNGQSPLVDPAAGSGTLLIEAGMIAADVAPALLRTEFGFKHWFDHIPMKWTRILDQAKARAEQGLANLSVNIFGFDSDRHTVEIANENIARAGLASHVEVSQRDISKFSYETNWGNKGLVVCNPPYGNRLSEAKHISALYEKIGNSFKSFPEQWSMAIISGLAETPRHLHLRPEKTYSLPNGPIDSKLYLFPRQMPTNNEPKRDAVKAEPPELTGEIIMFINRLRKNIKSITPLVRKRDIHAYRLYDADIPEYGLAIDVYNDLERGKHLHVQVYEAPKSIAESDANRRNNEAIKALSFVLDVPRHKIYIKKRERQKGTSQYDKHNAQPNQRGKITIREARAAFSINLNDYIDTGLFLDHRLMRERIASESNGKHVLNLFCYTSSVGVHAALAGANKTTNVDLSQTYIDWSIRNYHLNGIGSIHEKHRCIKADVMTWLDKDLGKYDLIFCDPPTFSNTKKTGRVFDVQTDHVELIQLCMTRLAESGSLYFSNNFRKFKLDEQLLEQFNINLLTDTIDFDFKRRANVHKVWKISN